MNQELGEFNTAMSITVEDKGGCNVSKWISSGDPSGTGRAPLQYFLEVVERILPDVEKTINDMRKKTRTGEVLIRVNIPIGLDGFGRCKRIFRGDFPGTGTAYDGIRGWITEEYENAPTSVARL
jgi:hypothetical protein